MPEQQEPISVKDFSSRIKSKYPEYKDIDDSILAKKMVEKYPEYKDQVLFEVVKKKEPTPSASSAGISPFQTGGELASGAALGKIPSQQKPISEPVKSDKYLDFGTPVESVVKPQMVKVGKPKPQADIKEAIDYSVNERIKQKRGAYDKTLPPPTKEEINREKDLVTKAYQEGDLIPSLNSKGESVLKRGAGLFESFVNAIGEGHERELENSIVSSMDKQQAINYLNTERQLPPKESETAPRGVLGKIGQFLGENIPILAKGTAGAIGGSVLAPQTGGASFGTFLATVNDMAKGGYSQALKRNYFLLKDQNPNITDSEAYDKANLAALQSEALSIGTGALLAKSLPFETPKPNIPVKGVLDGLAQSAKHAAVTYPKVGGSAALSSVLNDITSNAIGAKVGADEMEGNALTSAKDMAVMHFGLWALTQPLKIPSYIRPQVENVVASAPREEVKNFYQTMEQNGALPEGTTDKVLSKLTEFDQQKSVLANMPLSEEQKAAMTGKLLQRNKLVEENKTLKSYGGSFEDRIAKNDAEIERLDKETNNIAKSKNVFSQEVDSLTGEKPTSKAEETITTEETPTLLEQDVKEQQLQGEPEQITQPIELSTEIKETPSIPISKEEGKVEDKPSDVYYTGRGKKYENLRDTKGDFIFFSKNPKISEWYGGDETNVTPAKLDTSEFLDLTTQQKKADFVKENFTDEDIQKLYPNLSKEAIDDRDVRESWQEKLKEATDKKREQLQDDFFTGGKTQQALLDIIKNKGYKGVKLKDLFFGEPDISYVAINKDVIKPNETTPTEQNKKEEEGKVEGLKDVGYTSKKGNKATDSDGNPMILYHGSGTKEIFEEFKTNQFFTTNDYIAENYAENQDGNTYTVIIKTKNPFSVEEDSNKMDKSESGNLIAGTDKKIISLLTELYPKEVVGNYRKYGLSKGLGNIVFGDFDPLIKYAKENGYDSLKFKDASFDGMITADTYVVFDPKNVKKISSASDILDVVKKENETTPTEVSKPTEVKGTTVTEVSEVVAEPKEGTVSEASRKYEEIGSIKTEKIRTKEKSKFVDDNFESIVAQLVLKNKIKRIC